MAKKGKAGAFSPRTTCQVSLRPSDTGFDLKRAPRWNVLLKPHTNCVLYENADGEPAHVEGSLELILKTLRRAGYLVRIE